MSSARSPKRRCRSAFMARDPRCSAGAMHRTQPRDGDTGRTPSSRADQAPCILLTTRVEIGLQQRERHKIVLRTAAANSFAFARERLERVDRGGEVSLLERHEAAR